MQDQKLIDKNLTHLQDSYFIVNKLQNQEPDKQKKKSKLVLRRKINVPLLLNYSYIFKISQSMIINERALKQPTQCHESFMASIFYFKSIQSLSANPQFVSLSLKEVQKNQFPICYYTERFKSFGDRDFYQLAQTIELLDLQITKKYMKTEDYIEQEKERRLLKKQLADIMELKKGKKLLCLYSQPNGDHVTMNKIIVTTELLKSLGYKVQQLCRDFLRYRHVFFEIFDAQFYCSIVKKAKQRLNQMKEYEKEKKNPQQKQVTHNEQTFKNYIFRVRQDEKGLFQQKLPATITFSRPYPHLSVYEINEIDESKVVITVPQKHPKYNEAIQKYEQQLLFEQRQTLASLDYENLQK